MKWSLPNHIYSDQSLHVSVRTIDIARPQPLRISNFLFANLVKSLCICVWQPFLVVREHLKDTWTPFLIPNKHNTNGTSDCQPFFFSWESTLRITGDEVVYGITTNPTGFQMLPDYRGCVGAVRITCDTEHCIAIPWGGWTLQTVSLRSFLILKK